MSSEVATESRSGLDRPAEGARRAALRLAFGVTTCFALVEALNSDVTFLAPLLAANMLVKMDRPPSLRQGFLIIVLFVLSTGIVMVLTTALITKPVVLIFALTLLIYFTFYANRRGAPDPPHSARDPARGDRRQPAAAARPARQVP